MDNTCNYSDNWQPYISDYDKFEYDVKLKDGTIVENCYPNGGEFNSISDLHDGQFFNERDVMEIRFSQRPRIMINGKVSNAKMDPEYEAHLEQKSHQRESIGGSRALRTIGMATTTLSIYNNPYLDMYENHYRDYRLNPKPHKGKIVEVRTEPKIGRNQICPYCDRGLKYKNCCGIKGNQSNVE